MMDRRSILTVLATGLAGAAVAPSALAHHGWRWAEDGNFELTGIIVSARLGNPHGLLTVDVDGEQWTVEVGQPWRNERAGLSDDMLAPGREIRISGARSKEATDRRLKAERVYMDGNLHDLYPERQ